MIKSRTLLLAAMLLGLIVMSAPTAAQADPFELISQESLFSFLEDLTAIQPYSGWRNSATEGEGEALVGYVDAGGLLVITNSANRIAYGSRFDLNEDRLDVNGLAGRFGVSFQEGDLIALTARTNRDHPLMAGVYTLVLIENNGVPFSTESGVILAEAMEAPVVALVDYGDAGGQVLVLADLSIMANGDNLRFWQNLAQYAR